MTLEQVGWVVLGLALWIVVAVLLERLIIWWMDRPADDYDE